MDDGGGCIISWEVLNLLRSQALIPRRTIRTVLWTNEVRCYCNSNARQSDSARLSCAEQEFGGTGASAYFEGYKRDLNNTVFAMETDDGTNDRSKPCTHMVACKSRVCSRSFARSLVRDSIGLLPPVGLQFMGTRKALGMLRGTCDAAAAAISSRGRVSIHSRNVVVGVAELLLPWVNIRVEDSDEVPADVSELAEAGVPSAGLLVDNYLEQRPLYFWFHHTVRADGER